LEITTHISPFTQEHKPSQLLKSRSKLKPKPSRPSNKKARIRKQPLKRNLRNRKLHEILLLCLKFLL
jgi:hypothetical protein